MSPQNDIPVFCPALTDGSLGDMIYFHSYRSPGLVIDIVRDIRLLNDIALKARKAGMIILGGGVCKHQIANAMLMVSRSYCLFNVKLIQILPSSATGLTFLFISCVHF